MGKLLALLLSGFLLSGCATSDFAENFREFKWQKARNLAEAEEMCLKATGQKESACLKYESGVCHITSVDTEKNLALLGEQVKKCFADFPPTKVSPLVVMTTRVITYKVVDFNTVAVVCREKRDLNIIEPPTLNGRKGGCTKKLGYRYHIYVTDTERHPEVKLLGHEFKHADMMDWHHPVTGKPYSNAFIGVD